MERLFVSIPGERNVVLNFSNPKEEFPILATAYRQAAEKLVCDVEANGGICCDYEAYPILFLYRHSLELYLKAIVYKGGMLLNLLNEDKIDCGKFIFRHELSHFLPAMKVIWELMHWNWDFGIDQARTFDDFRGLVSELERIDPRSFAFRYPVDKKLDGSLPRHLCFNLRIFGKRMGSVLSMLDGATVGIEDRWDHAAEIVLEAERVLRDTLE